MATQLFVREENGSSMISQEGAYIQDKAARLVSSLLTEVEEDGAVDLEGAFASLELPLAVDKFCAWLPRLALLLGRSPAWVGSLDARAASSRACPFFSFPDSPCAGRTRKGRRLTTKSLRG